MNTIVSMKAVILFCSIMALFSTSHASDFTFGFELGANDRFDEFNFGTFPGNCGIGGVSDSLCGIGNGFETTDPDSTPFYQGEVYLDGQWYWHTIVGDPNTGFAVESYTRRALGTGFGSFSGGEPANFGGVSLQSISGNGWNPLASSVDFTGNGSGDPTKTVVRQVMGDGVWDAQTRTWSCATGEFCSEFLKDRLNFKPIISQSINDATTGGPLMQARFILDMSNLTYFDNSTAGTITNTLVLTDPSDSEFYLVNGNFNMATDTQAGRSEVTAGRYVYNNCSNPSSLFGGSCWQWFDIYGGGSNIYQEGSYTYSDGSNDPMAYNWESFFDPAQNAYVGSGVGSGNLAKCTSGAGGLPNSC